MSLVTGSSGFVGTHLVAELKRRGEPVDCADLANGVDLRDAYHARLALMRASQVYHLAADMGGIGYISKNHAAIAATNTRIDLNVLDAAREFGLTRLLYASSACAYPLRFQTHGSPPLKEEDAVLTDAEPGYGWEKRYMEDLVTYHHRDYGINTHITRFMNVYGPENKFDPTRSKVIGALSAKIARASNGDTIEVWGDGEQVRDFVHVEDVAKVLVDLMATSHHQPVNVGTGVGTSVADLVHRLIAISGKNLKVKFLPDRPTGVARRVADTANLKKAIGWVPQIRLEDALPEVYHWVAKQPSLVS